MYYDKNGRVIEVGNVLFFEDIGFFKLILKDKLLLENYYDASFPHLIFNKIVFDNRVDSASVVDNC